MRTAVSWRTQIMNHKKKTIIKWISGTLTALLVAFVVGAWAMLGTSVKVANSIGRLEDGLFSYVLAGSTGVVYS